MIFVDGLLLPSNSGHPPEGDGILNSLLEHPSLVSSSEILKSFPERRVSLSSEISASSSKHVYVFQREYATVDPKFVQLAGTDEATSCVAFIIRNRDTGMISIAHMDSKKIVDRGLDQILSSLLHGEADVFDVHLVGGFEDEPCRDSSKNIDGYSLPLCLKIIDSLMRRREQFHIKTLCVLRHNTERDSSGNALPIVRGILVETSSGSIMPARFDQSSRCPDEIVRRVRVTVSSNDSDWKGKLLETYDTFSDRFLVGPFSWPFDWAHFAFELLQLSDPEMLSQCSTSPLAENPDFVENERRIFNYLTENPNWRLTFPERRPRVFERIPSGGWKMCS